MLGLPWDILNIYDGFVFLSSLSLSVFLLSLLLVLVCNCLYIITYICSGSSRRHLQVVTP